MSWQEGLTESAYYFKHIVWPVVSRSFGCFWGATLVPNEDTDGEAPRLLDAVSGIDYWLLRTDPYAVLGLASRVMYKKPEPVYQTFTIGEWELEKRTTQLAMEEAVAFPEFTIQASVNPDCNRLLWAACVRTQDLIRFANRSPLVKMRRNKDTGKDFHVVWLEDLEQDLFATGANEIDAWALSSWGTHYVLKSGGSYYLPEMAGDSWIRCDGCGCGTTPEQRQADYQEALREVAALFETYRPAMDIRRAMERVTRSANTRTRRGRPASDGIVPTGSLDRFGASGSDGNDGEIDGCLDDQLDWSLRPVRWRYWAGGSSLVGGLRIAVAPSLEEDLVICQAEVVAA